MFYTGKWWWWPVFCSEVQLFRSACTFENLLSRHIGPIQAQWIHFRIMVHGLWSRFIIESESAHNLYPVRVGTAAARAVIVLPAMEIFPGARCVRFYRVLFYDSIGQQQHHHWTGSRRDTRHSTVKLLFIARRSWIWFVTGIVSAVNSKGIQEVPRKRRISKNTRSNFWACLEISLA